MKITTREKIMIIILVFVILIAMSYYFMFSPQLARIQSLKLEQSEYMLKVQEVKSQINIIDQMEANITELENGVLEKSLPYFPEIIQEKLIVIIDGIAKKTGINLKNIGFGAAALVNPPVPAKQSAVEYPLKNIVNDYISITQENPESNSGSGSSGSINKNPAVSAPSVTTASKAAENLPQLESMGVTLQVEGSYEQWASLIKEIEALNRTIVIKNLTITSSSTENNKISSNIQIDIFALPKLQQQDAEYLQWPYSGGYGKANPFRR